MADRWAVANGNWSDTATWNGGTLPTSADDVYADGKTVTIDQNVTALSIRTNARSGGVNGGTFNVSTSRTITATAATGIFSGTSAPCITIIGSPTITINANISTTSSTAGYGVFSNGASAQITINGNIFGSGSTAYGVYTTGDNCVLTVNGNTTGGGAGTTANAVRMDGISSQLTATGNVNGNAGGAAIVITGALAKATITGPLLGAFDYNGPGLDMSGIRATATIVGTVTGRTQPGLRMSGTYAVATVTGNITGGWNSQSGAVMSGAGSLITAIGTHAARVDNAYAGTLNHAINSSASTVGFGVVIVGSVSAGATGATPIFARLVRFKDNNGTTLYANAVGFPNGTPISHVSPNLVTGMPATNNVRSATPYGYNNELTGSMAVPPAQSVSYGVATGDTVGVAALKPADFVQLVGAGIANGAKDVD